MKQLVRSFTHAGRGILFALRHERNFQMEAGMALMVVLFMSWLPLTMMERIFLIIAIAAVLAIELVNTAIERVMDILKPRIHPYARAVKDIMAGAVLIVSGGALIVGVVIFAPYFLSW
jgi:diacylglycerol kinase